jgi:uncharacterized membrane protein YbaN (DUF454 family)
MKRIVRISLGCLAIIVGLAGFVLPILPGWLFLALGVLLLSIDVPFFVKVLTWIEDRIPPVRKPLERLRDYLGDSKKPATKNTCHFPED